MITIFTDGSSRGNPGPGGWAAIIADKESVKEIGGSEEHTTNNRMELMAVIRALEFVSKIKSQEAKKLEARIYTDSEYIVKGITQWVKGWQKNNWRTAAKKPVMNQDLWQELLKVSEDKDISWSVIPGHSGVSANERCDEIATRFADLPAGRQGANPVLYEGSRSGYTIPLGIHEKAF